MNRPLLILFAACAGLMLSVSHGREPVLAQQQLEDFTLNPDLNMPPGRTHDDASLAVREARQRVYEAIALEAEGKKEDALNKWRDALARYEALRNRFVKPEFAGNAEVLVRAEYPPISAGAQRDTMFAETYIPLVDHINSCFYSDYGWPRALRDRFIMRQQAPGAEMLAEALNKGDHALLRRCARFFQYSDAGRTALGMLAQQAAERGDSLNAMRWLDEYRKAWPDHFDRDPMLNLQLVRACRETDSRLRLDQALRRIETAGLNGVVDVGGVRRPLSEHVAALLAQAAPAERRELASPGWRTMQGGFDRNMIAPPVAGIEGLVPLGSGPGNFGYSVGQALPKAEPDPYGYREMDTPAVPVIFPTAHETGLFLHRPQAAGQDTPEQLLWFRHGRETSPVQLEVPKTLRYSTRPERGGGRGWWGGRQMDQRQRMRILSSSVGRLRWPLDNRESDVLFAVMGATNPQAERGQEPTGNQIQALDLSSDVSLRLTLPNRKVESAQDFAFLQHVTFMGAPVVLDNCLYIAGAVPEKSSIEFWLFCFDVTPRGDPAAGEGKLVWRTQCCSLANKGAAWGPQTITLTDMSSLAMQGGMLYLTTQSGATAGVDRQSGELCWVSRYQRPGNTLRGWFNNAPIAACGYVITAPYDSLARTSSEVAMVLDGITGTAMFELPRRGKGYKGEYEYVLGVVDNCMIIQGRERLHCVALTSYRKGGGANDADWGGLRYQSTEFSGPPVGRGVIAGDRVLVPLKEQIWVLDVRTGKLLSQFTMKDVKLEGGPVTLTVYCRGEAYTDPDGLQRYRPVTVTDPDTGNVYSAEHLPDGAQFRFPSGKTATVKKETFVIMASSAWVYLFSARDQ